MNSQSDNLRLMSEAKEVREYTDKQEARCNSILNRLSNIQIDLLQSHNEEQFQSFINQPPKKFGMSQSGRKLSTSSNSSLKCDPELRTMGLIPNDAPDTTPGSSQSTSPNFCSQYDGGDQPKVIVLPKESKRKRNPLYDTQLWKMPDIGDMQYVNSSFHSVLRQTAIGNMDLDDETESSSGDSSCDETMFVQEEHDGTPKRVTHYLPVEDNPAYNFAEDRATVIAMWTWLQDAVSNLSQRIKQQDEFAKHLAQAKPAFQFDEQPAQTIHRPTNSRAPPNAALKDACIQIFTANNNSQVPPTSTQVFYAGERKSPYMTDASGKVIQLMSSPPNDLKANPKPPNAGSKLTSSNTNSSPEPNSNIVGGGLESLGLTIQVNHDPSCTARRCMPLKPFKQRKIYQLGGIHNMASFAGRAPTLICTCFGRTELCAVCTGRARKTKVIDVELMDQKEIYELLDHNYHRTLSLPDETPIATQIESALIMEGWTGQRPQKKMKFRRLTMAWERPRSQWDRDSQLDEFGLKKRPRGRPRLPRGLDQFGHMVIKHPPKPAAPPILPHVSVKKRPIWRKDRRGPLARRASYGGDIGFRRSIKINRRKKYNSVSCGKGLTRRRREREPPISDDEGLYYQSYDDFMAAGFTSNKSEKRLSQSGRKLNQDYDIDQIVIPYSVASSARVEKVEYKEILIPRWHVIPEFIVGAVRGPDDPPPPWDEFEIQADLNDDNIKIRHDRCQVDEHKRFNSIPDKSSRKYHRLRLDSRTESKDFSFSSNPEDSPGPGELQDVVLGSLSPSPPIPTPSVGEVDEGMMEPQPGTSSGGAYGRRRTVSSTSLTSEFEENKVEVDWDPCPAPFETRPFPLTDEECEAMSKEAPTPEVDEEDETESFSYATIQNMSRNFEVRNRVLPSSSNKFLTHDQRYFDVKELGVELKDEEEEDGDLELMDVGEDSEGDGDDPDWQRAPGERAA